MDVQLDGGNGIKIIEAFLTGRLKNNTGQTILMAGMSDGVLHAGAFTISG